MKKTIKRILYLFLKIFYLNVPFHVLKRFDVQVLFVMGFFQRILRINSRVPWPVHWSSIVSNPDKIRRRWKTSTPGYMPAQYIQATNGIDIGYNVRMGPGVKLISADHDICDFDKHPKSEPIIIGDNCWLGADSILLSGVKLAEHTIVAAGAVVTKSFEDGNCVIAGVPAKMVKKIEKYRGVEHGKE